MTDITQKIKVLSYTELAQVGVELAYKMHSPKGDLKRAEVEKKLNSGDWEELSKSSDNEDTNQYGYKAVSLVNHITKQVFISCAGTKEIHDIVDDIKIVFGYAPNKLEPLKKFVTNTIDLITKSNNDIADYTFSTSGHSLGAVVSDLTAVEIISRNLNFDMSTTFENPGSKDVVTNAINQNLFSGTVPKDPDALKEIAEHCIEYNAKPNFINTVNSHFSSNINLVLSQENIFMDSAWGYSNYLCNKLGSAIDFCSEYLGIKSIVDQINSHKNKNFEDLDNLNKTVIADVENWIGNTKSTLVLKEDPMNKLYEVTSTGADLLIFRQNKIACELIEETDSSDEKTDGLAEKTATDNKPDDNYINLNFNEYSFNDLVRLAKYQILEEDIALLVGLDELSVNPNGDDDSLVGLAEYIYENWNLIT